MSSYSDVAAIIRRKIKKHVEETIPGAYYLLDLYCRKVGLKECELLILENPQEFIHVLTDIYGQQPGIKLIARVYLTPIVTELNPDKSIDEILELLINEPEKFKDIINKLLREKAT